MCPHNSLCEQNGEATAANCVVKGSFGMFWKAIKREIKSTSGARSCGQETVDGGAGVEIPVDRAGPPQASALSSVPEIAHPRVQIPCSHKNIFVLTRILCILTSWEFSTQESRWQELLKMDLPSLGKSEKPNFH